MERFKVKWCRPLCYVLIPLFIIVHSIQCCIELNLLPYINHSIVQLIIAMMYGFLVIPFGIALVMILLDRLSQKMKQSEVALKKDMKQPQINRYKSKPQINRYKSKVDKIV